MTIKHILGVGVLVIAGIIAFTGLSALTGTPAAVVLSESNPIRIGFIGPLSGDAALFGEIERTAMEIAVDEINSKGGINGRMLEIVYEDGKCTGKDGLAAAKKLVEIDHIHLLTVSCSQEVIPVASYANPKGILVLTSYASASDISNAGDYVFRISYTNKQMAHEMVNEALTKGKRIALLSETSEFATDLKDLFVKEVGERNGEIIISEAFVQGDKDMRTQVAKIVASAPEVVVLNPDTPTTGIAALKQLRQAGYQGEFIGNFFGGSKEVQALKEAQGMVYVSDPVFSASELKRHIFSLYEARKGKTPDLEWPLGGRYDAMYVLKQAFEQVGDDPTKVKEYLYQMPDFTGVLGTFHFDSNGDITGVRPAVAKIENFTSVPVK